MDNEFRLKADGKYNVKISEEIDISGTFKGYSSIGGEVAMVIEKDDGRKRFIPLSQIMYIDELEISETVEEPKKVDIYYR